MGMLCILCIICVSIFYFILQKCAVLIFKDLKLYKDFLLCVYKNV